MRLTNPNPVWFLLLPVIRGIIKTKRGKDKYSNITTIYTYLRCIHVDGPVGLSSKKSSNKGD